MLFGMAAMHDGDGGTSGSHNIHTAYRTGYMWSRNYMVLLKEHPMPDLFSQSGAMNEGFSDIFGTAIEFMPKCQW